MSHAHVSATADITHAAPPALERACACGAAKGVEDQCPDCAVKARFGVQPKLTVNRPGDCYEQEADRIADRVVSAGPTGPVAGTVPTLQREMAEEEDELQAKPAGVQRMQEEEDELQMKPAGLQRMEEDEDELQMKPAGPDPTSPAVSQAAAAVSSGGQPLSRAERSYFEPRLGRDLSAVRLHDDARAGTAAKGINARAYTLKNHIAFASGTRDFASTEGRRLMAHELVHTLQQADQRTDKLQAKEIDDCVDCAELEDVSGRLNAFVNTKLSEAREAHPSDGSDPEQTFMFLKAVFEKLGRQVSLGTTPLDAWAEALPDEIARSQSSFDDTKFSDASGLMSIGASFAVLLRVGDLCFGSDKLGHMTENGFNAFIAQIKSGGDSDAAREQGIAEERGTFGLMTTGVFSNADIASNLSGAKLYHTLADDPNYVFDIADFISPDWNECENASYYVESLALTVWKNLLTEHVWGHLVSSQRSRSMALTVLSAEAESIRDSADRLKLTGTLQLGADGTARISGAGTLIQALPAEDGLLGSPEAFGGIVLDLTWSTTSDSGTAKLTSDGEKRLSGRIAGQDLTLTRDTDPFPKTAADEISEANLIEEARAKKARLERWLDRVAKKDLNPRRLTKLRAHRASMVLALERYGELGRRIDADTRAKLEAFIAADGPVTFVGKRPIEIQAGAQ